MTAYDIKIPDRICRVDGCDKPRSGRHSLCSPHKWRHRQFGDVVFETPPTRRRPDQRFWAKVDRAALDECWIWKGTVTSDGYGQFAVGGKGVRAHRYAYELCVGPIPDGLTIDHVWTRGCRSTVCVNPLHLEAVTIAENQRRSNSATARNGRKTACPQGHPYDTVRGRNKARVCRECAREAVRRHRRKLKEGR